MVCMLMVCMLIVCSQCFHKLCMLIVCEMVSGVCMLVVCISVVHELWSSAELYIVCAWEFFDTEQEARSQGAT